MRRRAIAVFCGLALGAVALPAGIAQSQTKSTATYWMTVETTSGFTGSTRTMDLRLYSTGSAAPPQAAHVVPGGMKIGPSLPLVTPQAARAVSSDLDQLREFQRQSGKLGRLLLYWGCGEKAGAGQPFVLDLNAILQGRSPAGLSALRIVGSTPPSSRSAKTYGEWPQPDSPAIPADASLAGEHTVSGNYSPEIRFALARDFMGPMSLKVDAMPSGAGNASWPAVGGALGYSLQSFGLNAGGDFVAWTSSNVRDFGSGLSSHIPDAEVTRLIKQRAVLPPSTTTCAVPKEVLSGVEGSFINSVAYGGEQNFSFPPKPPRAPKSWKPTWAAKVRFLSTGSAIVADGEGSMTLPSIPTEELG